MTPSTPTVTITDFTVHDVRFPTSELADAISWAAA